METFQNIKDLDPLAIGLVRLNFLRGLDRLDWLDKNFEWRWLDKFLILVVAI